MFVVCGNPLECWRPPRGTVFHVYLEFNGPKLQNDPKILIFKPLRMPPVRLPVPSAQGPGRQPSWEQMVSGARLHKQRCGDRRPSRCGEVRAGGSSPTKFRLSCLHVEKCVISFLPLVGANGWRAPRAYAPLAKSLQNLEA